MPCNCFPRYSDSSTVGALLSVEGQSIILRTWAFGSHRHSSICLSMLFPFPIVELSAWLIVGVEGLKKLKVLQNYVIGAECPGNRIRQKSKSISH